MTKSKAILIQHMFQSGLGGESYSGLLEFNFARNLRYCESHKIDYQVTLGNLIDGFQPGMGGWPKVILMHQAFMNRYEHVIYLDTDTVIADLSADLRDGCPENSIGFVQHNQPAEHFNTGAIYASNCDWVKNFFKYWFQFYPGPEGWREQAILNLLYSCQNDIAPHIVAIDDKWNSTRAGLAHVDNAIVEGFHGEGSAENRLKLMQEFLRSLNGE